MSPARGEHTASGPTFSVGPMDVDSAAGITARLGTHNKAGALLRRHRASFPPQLMRILNLPKDYDATECVQDPRHLAEIKEAAVSARGRHQFLKEDDVVLTASVRDDTAERKRYVAIVYRKPSKRIARGAIDLDSVVGLDRAIEDFKADKAAKAAGFAPLAPVNIGGRVGSIDDALAAGLTQDDVDAAADAAREAAERDAANAMREVQERLERLEDPEPFADYGSMSPAKLKSHISKEGLALYGRVGLERISNYEEAHANRPSVVDAAKDALAAAEAAAQ